MKIAVFGTKPYDQQFLEHANSSAGDRHNFTFLKPRLELQTVPLAANHQGVCIFVNDQLDAPVLEALHALGIRLLVLRCTGFNNVDLATAARLGYTVGRVPDYSPYSVAEHAIGLMLCLNRQIHRAYNRVREGNFALDGLLGFDMRGRTAGVIGTGRIGAQVVRILLGFGCSVIAHDRMPDSSLKELGVEYVDYSTILKSADIISLHCPLTPDTHHMINAHAIDQVKPGLMLINTSRGGLLDTTAVLKALKMGRIGLLGLDVYEDEADLFFEDHSARFVQDDRFARLLTFPNVLITGHQAFFTREALTRIADTTVANITSYETSGTLPPETAVSV